MTMKNLINIYRILAVFFLGMAAIPLPAQEEGDKLTEEVPVRFDIQNRLSMTASVVTITAEELENVYDNDIADALAGRLPGLTVMQTSGGSTESSPTLYVRGRSSFNTASPLVFVDGLQSSLSGLMLSDIESISVLKDAAALSLYGQDGADGIIYVKTKRGVEGKPKVSVSVRHGWQQFTEKPEFVDAYTYATMYNEALSNDNGAWTQFYTDAQLDAYRSGDASTVAHYDLLYPNVNWYEKVLNKFAPETSAEASVSGGNKNIRYYVMGAFQDVRGLYKCVEKERDTNSNLDDQRFNFRINLDARISDIFDLKTNLSGQIRNQYRPNVGTSTLWKELLTTPANAFPVETEEGYGGNAYYTNPVADVLAQGWFNTHSRVVESSFTLGQNLDFILKGLRLEESIALYSLHQQKYRKARTYQQFEPYLDPTDAIAYNAYGTQTTDFTITNTGTSYNDMTNRLQEEVTARYGRKFGDQSIAASVSFHNDSYTITGLNQPLVTRGFAGRVGYGFDDRFFAEFDWSWYGKSAYAPSKNMGFFPAASLAYIIANNGADANVNFLKVRLSSGLSGMADLSTATNYYMYQQYWHSSAVGAQFGWAGTSGKSGLFEYYQANPDASWETLFRSNAGIDARLFKNRLSLNADVFYDRRTGILVNANVPDYFGLLSDKNVGDGVVSNCGLDGAMSWSDRIGDFRYTLSGTFSFAHSHIVNMNEAPTLFAYQRQTGRSVGVSKRYVADGFYTSADEISALPSMLGEVTVGDVKYKDLNGDGRIDSDDATFDGDFFSTVPEISYGLRINLAWKGFDFEMGGYGFARRQIDMYNNATQAFSNGLYNVSAYAVANRWAYWPEKGIDTRDSATFPRLTLGSNTNNTVNSTLWFQDGSLFRINNITLGYTFDKRISSRLGAASLRLYLAVINPFVFDSVYGDAEYMASYPLMKTYKCGLNLNF